jgi:hypothetical protein
MQATTVNKLLSRKKLKKYLSEETSSLLLEESLKAGNATITAKEYGVTRYDVMKANNSIVDWNSMNGGKRRGRKIRFREKYIQPMRDFILRTIIRALV